MLPTHTHSARRLRPQVERYLTALARSEHIQFDPRQLPGDPLQFAYLSAALLKISMEDKQKILCANSAAEMLDDLSALYHKEHTFLNILIQQPSHDSEAPFSLN